MSEIATPPDANIDYENALGQFLLEYGSPINTLTRGACTPSAGLRISIGRNRSLGASLIIQRKDGLTSQLTSHNTDHELLSSMIERFEELLGTARVAM